MIFMINLIVATILAIAVGIPLIIGIVYRTAKNDRQLTLKNTGEIKFRKFGGKITGLIMDIQGKRHDWESDQIVNDSSSGTSAGLIEKWFIKRLSKKYKEFKESHGGIAYVSILYPIGRIESWEFDWPKLVPVTGPRQAEGEGNLLEKYAIEQKNARVTSLYYQFLYPALAQNIELRGNFVISVLFTVTLTIKKPVHLIGNLKGKFMSTAISEAIGILDSALRMHTIDEWRESDRYRFVRDTLIGKTVLDGAIEITAAAYVDFDYSGNSSKVMEAITVNQIEVANAEALVTKRKGEADAATEEARAKVARMKGDADASIEEGRRVTTLAKANADAAVMAAQAEKQTLELRGQGEASRLKAVIAQVTAHAQGPMIYAAEQRAAGIRDFKGNTLVVDNPNRATVTLPAN